MPRVEVETHPRVLVHTGAGKLTLKQAALHGTDALAALRKAVHEEEEFELDDILEAVDHRSVKRVVAENVEYVLRREGMLSKDMSVVIPEGGYDYDLGGEETGETVGGVPVRWSGYFQGSFEVFRGDSVVAVGGVYGQIAPELLSITVGIREVF